jgi:hypothetical protein
MCQLSVLAFLVTAPVVVVPLFLVLFGTVTNPERGEHAQADTDEKSHESLRHRADTA